MASRSCALRPAAADDDDCAEDVAPRPELLGDTKRGEALRYGENASLPAASSSAAQVKIEALKKRPAPQWEQFKPGPNDETITPAELLTPKPSWYHPEVPD